MKSLKSLITPAISSSKEKLSLWQLNKDYKTLIGENIPFRDYGFRSLEELLQSQPEYRLIRSGNDTYVEVVQKNGNSSHMSKMVKEQKSGKRKPFRAKPLPPNRNYSTSRYRPKIDNRTNRHYGHGSSRPQAVHHAQIVTRTPPSKPKAVTFSVASRIQVPESSSYRPVLENVSQNMPTNDKRPVESNQKLNSNNVKTYRSNNNYYLASHNGNKATVSYNASTQSKPFENHADECTNPLISSRKRITMKMSELNLDSGHSSPTSDIPQQSPKLPSPFPPVFHRSSEFLPPAQLSPSTPLTSPLGPNSLTFPGNEPIAFKKPTEFVRTQDPLEDLKLLAKLHKLGEVIVKVTKVNNKHVKFYSCKIKVGKNMFSSYPTEFGDPDEATAFCSNEALESLIPKCRQKCLMLSSEKDILERIPPMLEKHRYGIFSTQLSLNYAVKYEEVLPDDWLKTIDASSCVRIEKISDNNKYILYHCKPGDRGQQRSPGGVIIPVSVPTNTVKFSEEGHLFCIVTRVVSANVIWCQQIDTEESSNYMEMFDRMQVYYTEHEQQCVPEGIVKGAYYIAKFHEDYYRVRVLEVEEDNLECFFIDSGEEAVVAKTDIFTLASLYATCQAQAFVCRLAGLEDWYEMSATSQCLASLQDQQVYLEASDVGNNDDDQLVLPVYMYDSATHSCINENLIPLLTMESASPTLQQDITEVYISNIENNGNVYVQVHSRGYMELLNLKAQVESQFETNPPTNLIEITKSNCQDKLFFKQHLGTWNRVKVIDWSPKGHHYAQIYFVDDGRAAVIDTHDENEKLYPLEKINDFLNNYPHQAIRVRMALDNIPTNFKELADKALPKDHSALLKCVGTKVDDIPLVKLYKRSDDGCLFCINESIALECELSNKKDEEQKHKFKFYGGTAHVPSTGSLKCPPLKIKDFFEVKVVMAVSPYNFIVQPYEFELKLNTMMQRLQIKCEQEEYGKIKVEDIVPGNIYASKHEDGIWYRANVIKVVNSGSSVSVFFCDFGNYQTLSVNNIVPLDKAFLELPYMALKAKLAGIKPTHSKWTMEHCERFKELVENKILFASMIDMEKDVLYQYDNVLRLKLIDTSTEDDFLIDQELIKLGIAVTDETV